MSQLLSLFIILVVFHVIIQYVFIPTWKYVLVPLWQQFHEQRRLLLNQRGEYFSSMWGGLKTSRAYLQNFSFTLFMKDVGNRLVRFGKFLYFSFTLFLKDVCNRVVKFLKFLSHLLTNKDFLRHLRTNLAIGLIVVLMLSAFHEAAPLMDIEDASMDQVMNINKGNIPARQKKGIPAFVLIDIDDDTYKEWKYPLFTPRNHLKKLIETAVQAKARLIIVDVDLGQNLSFLNSSGAENAISSTGEQELLKFIKGYKSYCQHENAECPLIILVRTFLYPEQSQQGLPLESRKTFLDQAVAESAPYVQWASATFDASGYDEVVRRWLLWQPTCQEKQPGQEKQAGLLPSIELLAGTFIRNSGAERTQVLLDGRLALFQPKNCQDKYVISTPQEKTLGIGDLLISVDTTKQGIQQRIMYSIPSENLVCDQGGCNPNDKPPIFRKIPAREYLKSESNSTAVVVLKAALKDKVVVIGGSHRRSGGGDIHKTPLGEMPGAMIVINSIYSLLQCGAIDSFPSWQKWIIKLSIEGVLIGLMTLFFEYYGSFLAMVLSGALALYIFFPFSMILLKYCIWLDIALPLLVVQFHHIAAAFEELKEHRCGRKVEEHRCGWKVEKD